jgi:hypothetical protein
MTFSAGQILKHRYSPVVKVKVHEKRYLNPIVVQIYANGDWWQFMYDDCGNQTFTANKYEYVDEWGVDAWIYVDSIIIGGNPNHTTIENIALKYLHDFYNGCLIESPYNPNWEH